MAQAKKIIVIDEVAGQRLDNYLIRIIKGVPKSFIYRVIRSGEVRVNKGRAKPSCRLVSGDVIRIPPVQLCSAQDQRGIQSTEQIAHHLFKKINVIHEDDKLLTIDKPAGLAVHGGGNLKAQAGLIEQLRLARPDLPYLELVHRIDKETSGVVLIAKKRSALRRLHEQFRKGFIVKNYLAIVLGIFPKGVTMIDLPIVKSLDKNLEKKMKISPQGKESKSRVRLLAAWDDVSLLQVQPLTGRTHQIRVHLASQGYPILGDERYGDFEYNKYLKKQGMKRMFLHAQDITFSLPDELSTESSVTLSSQRNGSLSMFYDYLKRKRQPLYRVKQLPLAIDHLF